jgi:glycosyltransferase involved in cell wall biosynthesis
VLLVNAQREGDMVRQVWPQVTAPLLFVPNAVRPEVLETASAEAFEQQFDVRQFVLCAARVEPNKNQLMLLWALRDSGLPLVCAGLETEPYVTLCKRWAGPQVRFTGVLSPFMLASAYAAARVHALPSWSETPGLSNLEAAVAGCSVVVGDRGAEQEYLSPYAFVSNPSDDRSIRAAVQAAWEDRDASRLQAQRAHVLSRYTWPQAAQATAAAYQRVLPG